MRNELYADSRDELKWTVATQFAHNNRQSIRWVAMFRQDINMHGDGVENVPNASPVVTQFFQQERQWFLAGAAQPALARIHPLCQQLGIHIDINLQPYACSLNRRLLYIEQEIDFLNARIPDRRDFVLVDPDNGIGCSSSNGKQFHENHVPIVWNCLRRGDTLAVVQFQHHEVNWVQNRRTNIAGLLGIQTQQIQQHHWNNICIYTANR